MDPISFVVLALVQGALGALTRASDDLVTTGYHALKRAIVSKAHSAAQPTAAHASTAPPGNPQHQTLSAPAALQSAIDQLELDPRSIERQNVVAGLLRQTGVGRDPEVVELSDELFVLIEDPLRLVNADLPVEQAYHRAGVQAVQHVLDGHVATVMAVRNEHLVEDTGLLTTEVEASTNLPPELRGEIAMLHHRMALVIQSVSQRMSDSRFSQEIDAIRTMPLAAAVRSQAMSLVEADKRIRVSYQGLRNTVEYFSQFNEIVLRRIEHESDVVTETNQMLGNAVLIFELTEYVIRYIENFVVDGEEGVRELHRQLEHRLATLRAEQEQLRQQASAPNIDPGVRAHTLADIERRESAIATFEVEWKKYLDDLDDTHARIGEVRDKIPTLEVIRDNARLQIDAVQIVMMLQFLKQNTDAIRGTIDVLTGFRLAPLSADRVRRLLGVGDVA